MVGHEVQDDFQSGIMSPFYKSLEFLHPPVRIIGKIWIYVVVVLYGIRGTGLTLDELGMRGHAALRSGLGRMPYDSRKPYMGTAQPPDVLKRRAVNVRKFPCAVVLERTSHAESAPFVPPESREHLVYDHFLHLGIQFQFHSPLICIFNAKITKYFRKATYSQNSGKPGNERMPAAHAGTGENPVCRHEPLSLSRIAGPSGNGAVCGSCLLRSCYHSRILAKS